MKLDFLPSKRMDINEKRKNVLYMLYMGPTRDGGNHLPTGIWILSIQEHQILQAGNCSYCPGLLDGKRCGFLWSEGKGKAEFPTVARFCLTHLIPHCYAKLHDIDLVITTCGTIPKQVRKPFCMSLNLTSCFSDNYGARLKQSSHLHKLEPSLFLSLFSSIL